MRWRSRLVWTVPFLLFSLLLAVPLASILQQAFFAQGAFSLSSVASVLSDPYFQQIARFTATQALWSALASAALGLFWAFVLTRYEFPFKRTLRALTVLPFVLPAVSLALGFVLVFGKQGMVNTALMAAFGLTDSPFSILYSLQAIVLAHAFYNAPIVARLTHAAWEKLDPSYEENARALGASPFSTFLTVTLPLLLPSILAGTALAFIYSFLSFPIVLTLGGARYATLEVEIYIQTIVSRDLDVASALAFVQLTLSLGFTAGYLWLERRLTRPLESVRTRRTVPLFRLRTPPHRGAGRKGFSFLRTLRLCSMRVLLWAALLIAGAFFAAPLLGVMLSSFQSVHGAWTLAAYRYVLDPTENPFIGSSPLRSVLDSLRFASGAMLLALLLGGPLAWAIARRRLTGVSVWVMLPLAISSVALGFGLLRAFSHPALSWLDRGVAVVLAHTLLALPFVVRALASAFGTLDPALSEAARSLGASRRKAFFQVELPLLRGAVLAGAAFAFAISIGEMSATSMLAQPGLKTMPLAIYSFLGARQADTLAAASAMSTVLIAVTALSFVLIERGGERAI
ncbi:MAG TPA: iron ABC transporter permease [Candidatus Bipolaricaulota bacterium]